MKSLTRWLPAVLLALVLVAVAGVQYLYAGSGLVEHMNGGAWVAAGMFGPLLGLKARSWEYLKGAIRADAAQPEFFPMTWYDTLTYTSATTVGEQAFFQQTNNDRTLSNMQLAGQFPADEYFELGEIHVDILERVTLETMGAADAQAVGAVDDLMQLMYTSHSTITLSYRNKPYGPVPLGQVRPLGGASESSISGAYAAATAAQFAGKWDGCGWIFEKQVVLGPTSKFGVSIQWPAVATLSQTTVLIRVALRGVHHRLVV